MSADSPPSFMEYYSAVVLLRGKAEFFLESPYKTGIIVETAFFAYFR
jgi:hypothetical protein